MTYTLYCSYDIWHWSTQSRQPSIIVSDESVTFLKAMLKFIIRTPVFWLVIGSIAVSYVIFSRLSVMADAKKDKTQ